MKKIQKSKKGFTLVEMVLVIAIIVILAAVLLLGIGTYQHPRSHHTTTPQMQLLALSRVRLPSNLSRQLKKLAGEFYPRLF